MYYTMPTKEEFDMFYGVFAHPVLWFHQHYLWDLGNEPVIDDRIHQAWAEGYVEVNRQVAAKVVEVARKAPRRPLVLVHDYQLYLVPQLVRKALPGAMLHHFATVPGRTPRYWQSRPKPMRDALPRGPPGCNIVAL